MNKQQTTNLTFKTGSLLEEFIQILSTRSFFSQKGIFLRSFNEICNDCKFNFFQKIGKLFRPKLKICHYRNFLELIAAKNVPAENFCLAFIFGNENLYILTFDEFAYMSKKADEPRQTAFNVSQNMMNILIFRNLKKNNPFQEINWILFILMKPVVFIDIWLFATCLKHLTSSYCTLNTSSLFIKSEFFRKKFSCQNSFLRGGNINHRLYNHLFTKDSTCPTLNSKFLQIALLRFNIYNPLINFTPRLF